MIRPALVSELRVYGLAAGLVWLYPLNVPVPNVPPADYALTVQAGSVTGQQTLFITVGQ